MTVETLSTLFKKSQSSGSVDGSFLASGVVLPAVPSDADADTKYNFLLKTNVIGAGSADAPEYVRGNYETNLAGDAWVRSDRNVYISVPDLLASTAQYNAGDILRVESKGYLYKVAAAAAVDIDLANAAGIGLYVLPVNGEYSVQSFGGETGTDIYEPLQAACIKADEGRDEYYAPNVFVDVMNAEVSDVIHTRKNFTGGFRSITIRGIRHAFVNANGGGTLLTQTNPIGNAPMFSANHARHFIIKDMTLIGKADDQLKAIDHFAFSTQDEATWDAALTAGGVTPQRRYSPNCAVAVDGYAGGIPDAVDRYPVAGAGVDYSGPGLTSFCSFENLTIKGFELGIAFSPGLAASQNDWMSFQTVRFEDCKYALSLTHGNHRIPKGDQVMFRNVWCGITGARHGSQAGSLRGVFTGGGTGQFVGKLVETKNFSNLGGLSFVGAEFESMWRIGDATTNSTGGELTFVNCTFKEWLQTYCPDTYFKNTGPSSGATIRIVGGRCDAVGVYAFKGVTLITEGSATRYQGDPITKDYMRMAYNGLAGAWAGDPTEGNQIGNKWAALGLGGAPDAFAARVVGANYTNTGRDYGIPIEANMLQRQRYFAGSDNNILAKQSVPVNTRFTYLGRAQVTNRTRDQRSVTVELGPNYNETNWTQAGYMPGGIAYHVNSGTFLAVRSVDTAANTVTMELLNNWWFDGTDYQMVNDEMFDASDPSNWVFSAVPYLAPQSLVGDISAVSSDITLKPFRGGAPAIASFETNYGIEPSDYLFADSMDHASFNTGNRERVTAVDTAAGTITMNGPASVTSTNITFDLWIRPIASEASR